MLAFLGSGLIRAEPGSGRSLVWSCEVAPLLGAGAGEIGLSRLVGVLGLGWREFGLLSGDLARSV